MERKMVEQAEQRQKEEIRWRDGTKSRKCGTAGGEKKEIPDRRNLRARKRETGAEVAEWTVAEEWGSSQEPPSGGMGHPVSFPAATTKKDNSRTEILAPEESH